MNKLIHAPHIDRHYWNSIEIHLSYYAVRSLWNCGKYFSHFSQNEFLELGHFGNTLQTGNQFFIFNVGFWVFEYGTVVILKVQCIQVSKYQIKKDKKSTLTATEISLVNGEK